MIYINEIKKKNESNFEYVYETQEENVASKVIVVNNWKVLPFQRIMKEIENQSQKR